MLALFAPDGELHGEEAPDKESFVRVAGELVDVLRSIERNFCVFPVWRGFLPKMPSQPIGGFGKLFDNCQRWQVLSPVPWSSVFGSKLTLGDTRTEPSRRRST